MNSNEARIISRENRILGHRKLYSNLRNIFYLLTLLLLVGTVTLIVYGSDGLFERVGSLGIWSAFVCLLFGVLCKARLEHISSIELHRRQSNA